jgi:crotonobetainyl-CoA:carnitine CoA-transferase CaiB-like acyl-CoA transferase
VRERGKHDWLAALEAAGVPCGPINDLGEVFEDPQVVARGMQVELPHPTGATVKLVPSPIKMSATPPEARLHPPMLGEHTDSVLRELLGYGDARIAHLRESKAI